VARQSPPISSTFPVYFVSMREEREGGGRGREGEDEGERNEKGGRERGEERGIARGRVWWCGVRRVVWRVRVMCWCVVLVCCVCCELCCALWLCCRCGCVVRCNGVRCVVYGMCCREERERGRARGGETSYTTRIKTLQSDHEEKLIANIVSISKFGAYFVQ
jgi:hypothetical protein